MAGHYQAQIAKLSARGLIVAANTDRAPGPPVPEPHAPVCVWVERELSGGERQTTNNRMEITALLAGLRAFNRPTQVSVHIDSRYVMDAFEKGWLARWQRTGWRTSAKEPVANRDLWEMLLAQYARHAVTFTWVQGHAGVVHNERVDRLAVAARDRAGELGQEPFDK